MLWTAWSLLVATGSCVIFVVYGEYLEGSVYVEHGKARFVAGVLDKQAAAYGSYNNTLNQTGWGVLDIKAGHGNLIGNTEVLYAAGYLEGILTANQMWMHYINVKSFFVPEPDEHGLRKKLEDFFTSQDQWMRSKITKYSDTVPLWRHVSYIVAQLDGLYEGYKGRAAKSWDTSRFVLNVLNGAGDLIDLTHALVPELQPDFKNMTHQEALAFIQRNGHCSAMIKVLGAFENVFLSHSSWFTYSSTMRIYKHYDFNVSDSATAAKKMSFSSYPGYLESLDDFYLLGSQMVLLQTTNNVFDMSLYKYVKPESLLAWHRVRLANMMAHNGVEWADIFSQYNSGTYNNQYMILDLKKIELNKAIHDNALWVVEQIPDMIASGDQTAVLRAGYWPSYNVPFYEKIYNASGYPSFVKTHGLDFSYQMAPRAKIFRRDEGNVVSLETMQKIMRYNDYMHDPYSESNPCNTICCRGDLDPTSPRAMGCYDTKVSDFNMAMNLESLAINGPTLGSGLKPFEWIGPFKSTSHVGLPEMYNFGWISTKPKW